MISQKDLLTSIIVLMKMVSGSHHIPLNGQTVLVSSKFFWASLVCVNMCLTTLMSKFLNIKERKIALIQGLDLVSRKQCHEFEVFIDRRNVHPQFKILAQDLIADWIAIG